MRAGFELVASFSAACACDDGGIVSAANKNNRRTEGLSPLSMPLFTAFFCELYASVLTAAAASGGDWFDEGDVGGDGVLFVLSLRGVTRVEMPEPTSARTDTACERSEVSGKEEDRI